MSRRRPIFTRWLLFAAFALLGWAADARAQGAAPDIDPAQIRFITPTASSSSCIGDPRTPLCALDTLFACIARNELRLCHRVGIFDYTPPKPAAAYRYRVLGIKILTEADMRPDLAATNWWKPGYADIAVEHLDLDYHNVGEHNTSYNLRPTAHGWEVIAWAVWGAENVDDVK